MHHPRAIYSVGVGLFIAHRQERERADRPAAAPGSKRRERKRCIRGCCHSYGSIATSYQVMVRVVWTAPVEASTGPLPPPLGMPLALSSSWKVAVNAAQQRTALRGMVAPGKIAHCGQPCASLSMTVLWTRAPFPILTSMTGTKCLCPTARAICTGRSKSRAA